MFDVAQGKTGKPHIFRKRDSAFLKPLLWTEYCNEITYSQKTVHLREFLKLIFNVFSLYIFFKTISLP